MLGNKLWNSLTPSFQLDLSMNSDEFKMGNEYDGPLLWSYIQRRVNPTTIVGASNLKTEMKKAMLEKFKGGVDKFNTWFEETSNSHGD